LSYHCHVILSAAKNLPLPSAHSELVEESAAISMKERHHRSSAHPRETGSLRDPYVMLLRQSNNATSASTSVSKMSRIEETRRRQTLGSFDMNHETERIVASAPKKTER